MDSEQCLKFLHTFSPIPEITQKGKRQENVYGHTNSYLFHSLQTFYKKIEISFDK